MKKTLVFTVCAATLAVGLAVGGLMLSLCEASPVVVWVSAGSLASSHSPKTCILGELGTLNCMCGCEWLSFLVALR